MFMCRKGGRKFLLVLLILSRAIFVPAQYFTQLPSYLNANSNWVFGAYAGISFQGGPPSAFASPLFSVEGAAAASSPVTGDLLFYSDGRTCYDRNHNPMPNGTGLMGNLNGSAMQGVCIVPFIDTPEKYFLFSLNPTHTPGQLWYSVVDMSLNNGFGDIVPGRKNILLDSNLSEAMVAIPGDNCDIWLVVHTRTEPVFKSYRISRSGLDPVPVLSSAGGLYRSGTLYNYTTAYDAYDYCLMAVSPDRTLIALGSEYTNKPMRRPGERDITGVLLCRFDPGAGQVSDAILLGEQSSNNICFSPDNKLLYIAYPDDLQRVCSLYQYDITLFDSAAIVSSGVFIHAIANPYNINQQYTRMCLLRDTIYMSNYYSDFVHRINRPAQRGPGCDFQLNAFRLLPGTTALGCLPSLVTYPLPPDTVYVRRDTVLCPGQELTLQTSGVTPGVWNDGSRAGKRMVTDTGTYYVTSRSDCHYVTDTFIVHSRTADTAYVLAMDTIVCGDEKEIILNAPSGFAQYHWDNGSSDSERVVAARGHYWVVADNYCQVEINKFSIGGANISFSLGNDTFLCRGIPLILHAPEEGSGLWSDGSTESRLHVHEPGTYWLSVENEGCIAIDTIVVAALDIAGGLGDDTVICRDQLLTLGLTVDLPHDIQRQTLWSDGTVGHSLTVSSEGTYWAEVCHSRDTILITEEYCDCDVEIPSAFTPNGDGKNDRFRPVLPGDCPVKGFVMQVYSRWGALVFATEDINSGWQGHYKGQPAEVGNYMYELRFEAGVHAKPIYRKGSVMLIR
jgi:gliding motility-associated-like protein